MTMNPQTGVNDWVVQGADTRVFWTGNDVSGPQFGMWRGNAGGSWLKKEDVGET